MATNLDLDPELLDRVHAVSGERTKKATVTKALEELIRRHEQAAIIDLFGTVEWDLEYDHKAERRRRDDKIASWNRE